MNKRMRELQAAIDAAHAEAKGYMEGEEKDLDKAQAAMDKAAELKKEYAIEKNCDFLMLNVWEFNENAVRFYEEYGFKTRTRHMEIKL